ncbi:MAG TPA: hypothetical protein VGC54_14395 [Planctomycetota bacterium]
MERIRRSECIRRLRDELVSRLETDDDTLCDIAAREGIFCRGFDRYPTPILRERFPWLLHHEEGVDREELLDRIRRWIHAREFSGDLPTACDVMAVDGDLCHGWDTFPDEKLEATYLEVFHEPVQIADEPPLSV